MNYWTDEMIHVCRIPTSCLHLAVPFCMHTDVLRRPYAADERVHAAHTTFTNTKSFGSVAFDVSLLPAFVVFRVIWFSLNDSAVHVSQKKRVYALTVFFPRVLNFFRLNSRFTNRISVYFAQIHLTQIKIE